MTDEELIKKTLELAEKGRGHVSPNPMVGAVVVKNGRIVGEGYHQRFGMEHAEIEAINSATIDVRGAILYVNLEPCSYYGKQPPCVEQILKSGIKKVVIGTSDPNPKVSGRGIKCLRDTGVEVISGVLEKQCRQLNEAFFKHVTTGLPLITIKIAQTIDGMIAAANGSSKWISSEDSRKYVHAMRSHNDAILTGIGTILSDNPKLNVRLVEGPSPRRVVLDSQLKIPVDVQLLNDALVENTIIATTPSASQEKVHMIEDKGASVWIIPQTIDKRVDLTALCKKLGAEGVTSILIEGGSQIISSFLKTKLVDKVAIFIAPKILGDGLRAVEKLGIQALSKGLKIYEFQNEKIGEDVLITGRLRAG